MDDSKVALDETGKNSKLIDSVDAGKSTYYYLAVTVETNSIANDIEDAAFQVVLPVNKAESTNA